LKDTPDNRRPRESADPLAVERIARRVEQIRERNDRLVEQMFEGERRFRSLAKAVWKVQEEERRRLARELHDGIGQTLTALVNQLRRPAGARDTGSDAEDPLHIAEIALRDVRELSRLLRPPVLDDLGLRAALQWLARTLRQHGGLSVAVDWQGSDERLDAEVETLVFRIAQEGLNNVLKHSGQLEARLAVNRNAERLELEIVDGGSGFDAARALSPSGGVAGLGLRGMRDRVEMFSGQFAIDSAAGRGSRLRVVVPLSGTAP
jgi:signal transduction histidine kinase